jgi:hypothetical protein
MGSSICESLDGDTICDIKDGLAVCFDFLNLCSLFVVETNVGKRVRINFSK